MFHAPKSVCIFHEPITQYYVINLCLSNLYSFPLTVSVTDITQWAVLAIRNLCENNPTNQMLVAGLESRGSHNTAGLLQEMGCEVEVAIDGKMKVKGQVRK